MHLRLNIQTGSALIAGVLLLLAVGFAAWTEYQQTRLGRMTYAGDALVRIRAAVPEIGPFESFNVNHMNPFIPQNERERQARIAAERAAAIAAGRKPDIRPTGPKTGPMTPVAPPTRPPPLRLPRLNETPPDAPRSMGMIGSGDALVLLVRPAGSEGAIQVPIGQNLNGWTLVGVEGGNQAVWEDPAGSRHTFPIGSGDLADPQALADTGGGDKKDDGKKDGGTKKDDGKKKDAVPAKAVDAKKSGATDAKAKPDAGKKPSATDAKPPAERPRRTRAPETPVLK